MVTDSIEKAALYYGLGPGIEKALKFLQESDLSQLGVGRHMIEGDAFFVICIEYDTKPMAEGAWEAHRQYIDVQYVASGSERMGYTPLETLSESTEYDADKDIVFLTGEGSFINAPRGTFAIFMPQDAHMPGMAISEPEPVRKIVVKIRV